jgi:hypothetical protein
MFFNLFLIQLIELNYNRIKAFKRAVKVFRLSYVGMSPKDSYIFHIHSILYIIESRLRKYQKLRNLVNLRHQTSGAYKKTSIRKRADPNTESAFWSTPITSIPIKNGVQNVSDEQFLEYMRSRQFF